MIGLKLIYFANVVVASWISYSCVFIPKSAVVSVFSGAFEYSEAIRLVGTLWGGIFVLSIIGLFYPKQMALVLVFQLIYKGSWLLLAAVPALIQGKQIPGPMAIFFVIWIAILPFVIPWRSIFASV